MIPLLLSALLLPAPAAAQVDTGQLPASWRDETSAQRDARMAWWNAARFGMFVHWGPVALTGHEIGWSRGTQTPAAEYDALAARWNPAAFDADAWAQLAADAGMKYLVITTKHHDGFSLWDSAVSEHDLAATPFDRDLLAELAAACEARGVRFCTYYSLADWYHPDYAPQNMKQGGSGYALADGREPDMDRYVAFMKAQLAELVERYGTALFWFDGEWEAPWSIERGEDLRDFLWRLDPALIVNNRIGKGRSMDGGPLGPGDYDTPEQRIGAFRTEQRWETCMTIARQWAWKPDDPVKSLRECLRGLIRCAAGDGNFLFNIGPMADGAVEPEQAARLREMGAWLKENGDTIYGTRGGPWQCGEWGGATWRGDRVWLHLFDPSGPVLLPAFGQRIVSAELRGGGALEWNQDESGRVRLVVPESARSPIDTIVELRLEAPFHEFAAPGGPLSALEADPRFGQWISREASFFASSTSQWDPRDRHPLLLDPSPSNPEFVFHTDIEESPWIVIDLGAEFRLGGVAIDGRPGWPQRMEGLKVALSIDGVRWEPAWTADEARDRWELPLIGFEQTAATHGPTARYLRIGTAPAEPAPFHLRFVRVYGVLAE